MPGKMTKSIPTTPGTGSRPQVVSILREGRKNANIPSARESSGESRFIEVILQIASTGLEIRSCQPSESR
jgi:hypothetical protein